MRYCPPPAMCARRRSWSVWLEACIRLRYMGSPPDSRLLPDVRDVHQTASDGACADDPGALWFSTRQRRPAFHLPRPGDKAAGQVTGFFRWEADLTARVQADKKPRSAKTRASCRPAQSQE